jgi:ribonuclease D
VLRALAAWREQAAQQRDLPRGRILRDEALIEIATHAPHSVEALARTRGLGKGVAEGKLGREILDAVASGIADRDPPAPAPQKEQSPPGLGPLIELLRVLLKQRCEDFEVAQKLVASADDLEAIAADDKAEIPALHGWRRDVFGADALALKHGALALTVGRKGIELVPLPGRSD